MKTFTTILMLFVLATVCQGQIGEDNGQLTLLDSTKVVDTLPNNIDTEYLLSGDEGKLQKVEVIDAGIIIPIITTAASDTTGYTPSKAGDIFVDTLNNKVYISKSSGRGKYILLNWFLPLFLIVRRKKQ